jgi:hypothetical protein
LSSGFKMQSRSVGRLGSPCLSECQPDLTARLDDSCPPSTMLGRTIFLCCDIQVKFGSLGSFQPFRSIDLPSHPSSADENAHDDGHGRPIRFLVDPSLSAESAIYGWGSVIRTATKMTKFAKVCISLAASTREEEKDPVDVPSD